MRALVKKGRNHRRWSTGQQKARLMLASLRTLFRDQAGKLVDESLQPNDDKDMTYFLERHRRPSPDRPRPKNLQR